MKKKMLFTIVIGLIGICILAFLGFATFVLSTENSQYKANKTFPFPQVSPDSKTLVAYFSRSKNTEVAAKAIASRTKGSLLAIEAKDYAIGLKGWVNANQDARNPKAEIQHAPIDFTQIDTLYIGSPIWWYSPAPPIWEFIGSKNLEGVKVILFNTYNSKFEQQYIDQFAALVREKGGDFSGHIHVKRGRMGSQIAQKELADQIIFKLDSLME